MILLLSCLVLTRASWSVRLKFILISSTFRSTYPWNFVWREGIVYTACWYTDRNFNKAVIWIYWYVCSRVSIKKVNTPLNHLDGWLPGWLYCGNASRDILQSIFWKICLFMGHFYISNKRMFKQNKIKIFIYTCLFINVKVRLGL